VLRSKGGSHEGVACSFVVYLFVYDRRDADT